MIRGAIILGLYHTRLRDEIFDGFRRQRPGCRVEKLGDPYCLVLYETLKDLSSAHDVLDALVAEWLDYCKSIGGLKLNEQKIA